MKSDHYLEGLFGVLEKERSKYKKLMEAESSAPSGAGEGARRALEWAKERLRSAGAAVEPCQAAPGAPPLLLATLGKSAGRKTLLVYGHLDLAEVPAGGRRQLFGRGVSDARGPLVCLFTALEVHRKMKADVPVNLRFILEAMKDSEAPAFKNYLYRQKTMLFRGVDYICLLDSRCCFKAKPFLTWGMRGMCEFELSVDCAPKDLRSGTHSGAVYEAMTDLVALLSSLVNTEGEILVPGVEEDVDPLTSKEEKDFGKATFDVDLFKAAIGTSALRHKEDKKQVQMHLVRFPTLSINGILSSSDSDFESIPGRATGRFCLRTVPHQSVAQVEKKVTAHLTRKMAALKSPNKMALKMTLAEPPWQADSRNKNFQAALSALKRATKLEPELVREGGTMPILNELKEKSGIEVLLLPVGRSEPVATTAGVNSFLEGTKTICAYFYELAN